MNRLLHEDYRDILLVGLRKGLFAAFPSHELRIEPIAKHSAEYCGKHVPPCFASADIPSTR